MGENNKNYDVRRKTASAMALAVMAPGVFPAGAAMAESAGRLVPEREGETVWASGSDAGHGGREWREKQGAEEHRTGEGKKSGDAQEYDQMHDEEDDEEADEIELEDDWLARLKHALWFEVATSSDAQLQDETELLPGTTVGTDCDIIRCTIAGPASDPVRSDAVCADFLNRGSVDGLEWQRKFSGRRNKGGTVPD